MVRDTCRIFVFSLHRAAQQPEHTQSVEPSEKPNAGTQDRAGQHGIR